MIASKKRAGPALDLARVETFFALQLGETRAPLPPGERDKIEDLRDDARWADAQANRLRVGRLNWLGRSFARFERWAGNLRPSWILRKMEQLTSGGRYSGEAVPRPHPVPPGTSDEPLAFAADFHLFDRLSLHYGGDFRGAVLINYLLGTLGSAAIIFSISPPFGLQPFIDEIHKIPQLNRPWTLVLETACIMSILIIFLIGRTPERKEDSPRSDIRWFGRRWHQRWLEYRVLAERFRYLELLLPFGKEFVERPPFVPERDANRYWHDRYFIWRATAAQIEEQSTRQYRDRVLAVMAAQEQYHAHNHRRRGTIARRLHLFAAGLFLLSLLIGSVDLALAFYGPATSPEVKSEHGSTLLFFAALLPVFSAAIHGVLAQTEYIKLAETSAEVAARIHDQYEQLAAVDVTDGAATSASLEPLRETVFAFAATVVNEATGWTATLRDKNVPLA